jgi:tetratricopeptide (TPR) repeat protein
LNEQARLWSAVSPAFQSRPDLAAQVRLNEARVWESNGNLPKAGQCYEEVLKRFINAGPFALDAVLGAESVLTQMGQSARVLALYDQASKMATKPKQKMAPEFLRQSNWYRLRVAYAKKLDQAGRTREAEAIRTQELSPGTPSH